MRVLAGAFLAMLATGPTVPGAAGLAVTLDAQPVAHSCAVVSTATVVAYDATVQRSVSYRFVRSDGSVSAPGRLTFSGEGAVAQSVRDTWTPRGTAPWVALEITAPERLRSQRRAVARRCARPLLAATH